LAVEKVVSGKRERLKVIVVEVVIDGRGYGVVKWRVGRERLNSR